MDFFCVSSPLCKTSILCCCNDTWVPFDRLDLTSSNVRQHFSGGQENGPVFSCCCQITLNSLCLPLMHCNAMAHRETNTSRTNVYPITLQCNHCTHYTTSQWCKISFSEEDSIAASNMSFDAGASLRLISLFFCRHRNKQIVVVGHLISNLFLTVHFIWILLIYTLSFC